LLFSSVLLKVFYVLSVVLEFLNQGVLVLYFLHFFLFLGSFLSFKGNTSSGIPFLESFILWGSSDGFEVFSCFMFSSLAFGFFFFLRSDIIAGR